MIRTFGTSLLILLSSLYAKEYYISFRFSAENSVIISQNFNCSKVLKKKKFKKKFLFKIKITKPFACSKYKEIIIQNLYNQNIYISSTEKKTPFVSYKDVMTFLPHLFDIIINNDYAYFYIKDER